MAARAPPAPDADPWPACRPPAGLRTARHSGSRLRQLDAAPAHRPGSRLSGAAHMSFPTRVGFGGTNSGANVTTTTIDIPTRTGVTPQAGDLVIIAIVKDGTGAFTWPGSPAFTSFSSLP